MNHSNCCNSGISIDGEAGKQLEYKCRQYGRTCNCMKKDKTYCHLYKSEESNHYCTNKSCYEYIKYQQEKKYNKTKNAGMCIDRKKPRIKNLEY